MNEFACFCDGECHNKTNTIGFNPNIPPYVPSNGGQSKLYARTLSMDATSYKGIEYNVHNLHNLYQVNSTAKALINTRGSNKRAFIISRASYPSMGVTAGHWLGDNKSTWEYLASSIAGILNFNMFGIPLVGADICGFRGDTTKELCARWIQLGVFYPFARSHNAGKQDQEPYVFGQDFIDMAKKVLGIRYSLLNYYYTLFYKTHTMGGTVARPLLFEFSDPVVYDTEDQFLIGKSLMISPVLKEKAVSRHVYFPGTDGWYDFYNGTLISKGQETLVVIAPIDYIPLHIRASSIIPLQYPALTTTELRNNTYNLVVALDSKESANGDLFIDDGDTIDTIENGIYTLVEFIAISSTSTISIRSTIILNRYTKVTKINTLTVLGSPEICDIQVNGKSYSQFSYNQSTRVLLVSNLNLPVNQVFIITLNKC
jgi:lysosomal alpha-glucosidase